MITTKISESLAKELKEKAVRDEMSVADVVRVSCWVAIRGDREFTEEDMLAWQENDEEMSDGTA